MSAIVCSFIELKGISVLDGDDNPIGLLLMSISHFWFREMQLVPMSQGRILADEGDGCVEDSMSSVADL